MIRLATMERRIADALVQFPWLVAKYSQAQG